MVHSRCTFFPEEEEEDDEGEMGMNSSVLSEAEDDDSQLSKKDVSFDTSSLHRSVISNNVLNLSTRLSLQKNRKRRNRKKKSKKKRAQEKKEQAEQQKEGSDKEKDKDKEKENGNEVEIEYVTEEPEIYDPNFIFFKRIFEAFRVNATGCLLQMCVSICFELPLICSLFNICSPAD